MTHQQPTLLAILVAVDASFILVNLAYAAFGLGAPVHLNVDHEANLPTWWSSAKLAALAVPFFLMAIWFRRDGRPWVALAVLAAFFLTMSIDETARLHEAVGHRLDGDTRQGKTFHRTGLWFAVVGIPAIIVFAAIVRQVAPVLSRVAGVLPLLVAGFGLLACGALAVEAVGNLIVTPAQLAGGPVPVAALIGNVAEEGFEMLGASLMVAAAWRFVLGHPDTPYQAAVSGLFSGRGRAAQRTR